MIPVDTTGIAVKATQNGPSFLSVPSDSQE
jgi:hypothetical protein